jgi:hypothetical protein
VNGTDPGNVGYQLINFGEAATNSFVISGNKPATVTKFKFYIYAVNDLNYSLTFKWKITTQPFGGDTIAQGKSEFSLQGLPWENAFLPARRSGQQVASVEIKIGPLVARFPN